MTSRSDVVAASWLIRRALDRERPRAGSDYEGLLARYRTDTGFADAVAAVCEGLGLYVIGSGPAGLILHGDQDGPFRVTLDNCGLRSAREAEHRHVYALVLAGVAAFGYRDAGALSDTAAPVLRPADLERFLSGAVRRLSHSSDDVSQAVTDDEWETLLGAAGQRWAEIPPYHLTPQGRPKVGCHRWYTTTVLEWLADNGMAVRQAALSDERGTAYQLTDRFRLGIAELIETDAFAVLTEEPQPVAEAQSHGMDRSIPRGATAAAPPGSPAEVGTD